MTIPDWVWPALGFLIAVAGLYFGRRDIRDSGRDDQIKEQAKLNTKIDIVVNKTDSIDRRLETGLTSIETRLTATDCKQQEQAIWLARVEESAKSAHKRLDELNK